MHAVIVDASIGRGRIKAIDARAAEKHAGVLRVIHHGNAPKLPYRDNAGSNNPQGRRLRVFQDDRVLFHGQPVAVVVATTLEAAQHGASLVKVRYDADKSSTDITKAEPGEPTPYARGDAEAGLSSSAVRLDLKYELARNHHNPMEPHATVARWDGNRVTVWDKTQWVVGTHAGPPLVGTVIAVLTLLPLLALAVHGTAGGSRIVAQHTAPAHALDDPAVRTPSPR